MLLWWASGLMWLLSVLLCLSLSVWKMTIVYNEKTNLLLKAALRSQEGTHTSHSNFSLSTENMDCESQVILFARCDKDFCFIPSKALILAGVKCDGRDLLCSFLQLSYWSLPTHSPSTWEISAVILVLIVLPLLFWATFLLRLTILCMFS